MQLAGFSVAAPFIPPSRISKTARPRRRALGPASLLLPALVLWAAPAAADKYAGEFLHVGAGARALGMGGAFVAVADDASAAWWNPAGLSFLPYKEILYMHAEQFGSAVNYDYGSFVWPLAQEGTRRPAAALSLVRLGVSDIPVTPDVESLRPGIDFQDDDGDPSTNLPTENNGRWDPGERLFLDSSGFGTQGANDWALFLSYGRPFGSRLTAGASLKVVYRSLPDIGGSRTAYGAGLDAGITFAPRSNVTLGIVARDVTTTFMHWDTGTNESVSPNFVVGGQYTASIAPQHALTVALDVPFNFDGNTPDQRFGVSAEPGNGRSGLSGTFHVGAEYWFHNTVALRSGMMGRDLTFGAGLRHQHLGADYAAVFDRVFGSNTDGFVGDDNLDVSHRISASYNF